jgi:hypothetical protein
MKSEGHKIRTLYWAKSIPDRQFDWEAWLLDKGEEGFIGRGSTEIKAIEDLLVELEARGE